MHEIFKYERVKERLFRESYSWERAFTILEKVIDVSDIVISYPQNLYGDKPENISIYFFNKNCICHICSKLIGREFKIRIFKAENISEVTLSNNEEDNISLTIVLNNENIVLSSTDDTNQYHSYKYAEALVQIAGIYSK